MKIKFSNLYKEYFSIKKNIDRSMKGVIKNSAFIRGKYVTIFENNFKSKLRSKYCLTCNNGTDALILTMISLGLKNNDEVITTAHSWISSSSSITKAGGRVVFCDVKKNTFNIDPNDIEKKITRKTVGIVLVHLYGEPADIIKIKKLAKKNNLWIVEDCAQSHFVKYNKKFLGTHGDAGSFSFYPSKILGGFGDSGAIVTNNKKLYIKALKLAQHGGLRKHIHEFEGFNSRMDGLQAAVLNEKLKILGKLKKNRKAIAKRYYHNLKNLKNIQLPNTQKIDHGFYLYVIKAENRNKLKKYLNKNNIETQIHYPNLLPFLNSYRYLNYKKKDFPNALLNQSKILSLPMYPQLKFKEIDYISKKIIAFYSK